jgi:hypothetical protein
MSRLFYPLLMGLPTKVLNDHFWSGMKLLAGINVRTKADYECNLRRWSKSGISHET